MTTALLVLGSPGPLASQFLDVPQGSWFEGAVSNLDKLGLLNGYPGEGGRYFRPSQAMTRAEFLRLCLRALVKGGLRDFLDYPAQDMPFPDVPVNAWFASDVAFAKEWGVVDHDLPAFEPNRAITREEAAEMISRTMEPVPIRGYPGFPDVAAGNEHIRRVYSAGIANGYGDGTFRPTRAVTRAEAAVLIERAYFVSIVPPVIGLKMSVFSPSATHLPEVEIAPEFGAAGIRLNRPDSQSNLVRTRISGSPASVNEGVRYFLRRSNSYIDVWRDEKRTLPPLLSSNDEWELSEQEVRAGMDLWVENTSLGETDLVLEARDGRDGAIVESERVTFRTFRHLVIVLGGEFQKPEDFDPAEPTRGTCDNLCGVYQIGHSLRRFGYDVRIFDEDDVDIYGNGPVLTTIREALQLRFIDTLALIGYSHGGGSVMDLSLALRATKEEIGGFTIPFTAYIDAILTFTPGAEDRRPLDSLFHLNIYQEKDLLPQGDEVPDSPDKPTKNLLVTNEDWGADLGHKTIDDHHLVAAEVIHQLRQRVQW